MMSKQVYISYISSQKTRHQKLNSYCVTYSLEDNSIHTAEPPNTKVDILVKFEIKTADRKLTYIAYTKLKQLKDFELYFVIVIM